MAIVFATSFPFGAAEFGRVFDYYGNYVNDSGGDIGIHTGGRWGARFLYCSSRADNQYSVARLPIPETDTVIVQFGFYWIYLNDGKPFFHLLGPSYGIQWSLQGIGSHVRVLRAGSTSNEVAKTSKPIRTGTWMQMEIKSTISSSAGTMLLKVDGEELINASGLNNQGCGTPYVYHVSFGDYGGGANSFQFGFSDVIVMDTSGSYCNDVLGTCRVQAMMPTADGNYKDSTPYSGSDRYAMVDEIPPVYTNDYNAIDAVGETDTFVVPDLGSSQNVIKAVVPAISCKTMDGGMAKIKGVARHGGQDGYGPILAVPGGLYYVRSPIYVNPSTGSPFTNAEFNAAEFGYKYDS